MSDTRGQYRLSCEHLTYLSPTLNSFNLQLTTEASLVSCVCVTIILICIGVRPTFIHVFVLYDEMLQRNVYWYKKTLPNGNWKLFQLPADIYMVRPTVFWLPFARRLIEFS